MKFYKLDHEATMEDIKQFNYPNQKLAVIAHIKDINGKILLQQRGPKSRDENGLFQDISGKIEEYDFSFKNAIKREIKEEIGNDANIEINSSLGIYHLFKNNINWLFIVFDCRYLGGKLKIMEKGKCLGYDFFYFEEIDNSPLVTKSSKFLNNELKKLLSNLR